MTVIIIILAIGIWGLTINSTLHLILGVLKEIRDKE